MSEAASVDAAPAVSPFAPARGRQGGNWKLLIYGTPGCGKSTFATYAPKPYFLDLENGLKWIDCDKSPFVLRDMEQVKGALRYAIGEGYKTVVIDTIDEIERMLSEQVCKAGNRSTLVDFGYGKGHDLLVEEWKEFVGVLNAVQARGVNVILIGHEQVKKFEDPTSENYDRYLLRLHQKSAAYLTAKMDAVLFARYETLVKEKEDGRGRRAVGSGKRILHATERPCWMAKNRFGLPDTLPMDASVFEKLI